MINGISMAGLSEFTDEVRGHPKEGFVNYQVRLSWQTGVRSRAETKTMRLGEKNLGRDFSWTVDEPRPLLGHDQGASPQEYLLAGFGACVLVAFAVAASVRGVQIDRLEIDVRGNLDLAGFLGAREGASVPLRSLDYTIRASAGCAPHVLEEIHLEALSRSPNAQTLMRGVRVRGDLTVAEGGDARAPADRG